MTKRGLLLILSGAVLSACSSPAIVVIAPNYDPSHIRRVALLYIRDNPGMSGSGEIASSTFEKYLLWAGYNLVERRQVTQLLKEQSLNFSGALDPATIRNVGKILGVDALIMGNLTEF